MTLPTSGPLTLADIQTEFGGSNPISLSEYYAGGGLVPSGTTGTFGAVPSSGAISIRDFYGTSAFALGFDANFNMLSDASRPATVQASFTLNTNATVSASAGSITAAATRWGNPTITSVGSAYEVRLEVSGISVEASIPTLIQFAGVNVTATGNTPYYALSSARSLIVEATSDPDVGDSDFSTLQGTIRIRQIANPANEATATFTLTANADQ
jgi:hypothetical protein